jgi:hypothetical protein
LLAADLADLKLCDAAVRCDLDHSDVKRLVLARHGLLYPIAPEPAILAHMKTAQVELIEVKVRMVDGAPVFAPGKRIGMFTVKARGIDELRRAAGEEAKRRTGRAATINFGDEIRPGHFAVYAKVRSNG